MKTLSFLVITLVLMCPALRGQNDPAVLQDHDQHEGLLVAADPYVDAARAKEKFGKSNPYAAGMLPVDVYFKNETDTPLRINLKSVRLEVSQPGEDRDRVAALSLQQVAVLIAHPEGARNPTARRLPNPLPIPKNDKKEEKIVNALRPLAFDSDILPPHSTLHGFCFFDLSHDFDLTQYATLYIPDVTIIPTNKPLMYFEVPLGPHADR
jgi:hypothetical protein